MMVNRNVKQSRNFLREGYRANLGGYVTQLIYIVGKNANDLELSLGYEQGALSLGYALYFLDQNVGPFDFAWKDKSRYSDGWVFDRSCNEYIQRSDQIRWGMNKDALPNMIDCEIDLLMVTQLRKLNIRSGCSRIAKIIPMASVKEYPDAPGNGVPQWKICAPKQFVCAAIIESRGIYLGGGAGEAVLASHLNRYKDMK